MYWDNGEAKSSFGQQPTAGYTPDYGFFEGLGDAVTSAPFIFAKKLNQEVNVGGSGIFHFLASQAQTDSDTQRWLQHQEQTGFEYADSNQKGIDNDYESAAGFGSKTLLGVADMVSSVAAGGPAGAALAQGSQKTLEQINKGEDLTTAYSLGTLNALATYVGAKVPMTYGEGLAQKMAFGAGTNVALGIGQRSAEKGYWMTRAAFAPDDKHFDESADAIKVMDPASIAADIVLGGAFGAFGHVETRLKDSAEAIKHLESIDEKSPVPIEKLSDVITNRNAMEETIRAELDGREPHLADAQEMMERTTDPNLLKDFQSKDTMSAIEQHYAEQSINEKLEAGLISPQEATKLFTELTTKSAQNETVRSELPTNQDLATISGRAPQESWAENTRVTGADGEPATIYRGSREGKTTVEDFNPESAGKATGHPSAALGVWFSGSKKDASTYGKVAEHHLDLRNPKVYSIENFPGFDNSEQAVKLRKDLEAKGYDGIVIDARNVGGPVQFVAFHPEQVINKSKVEQKTQQNQVVETKPEAQPTIENLKIDPSTILADGRTITEASKEADANIEMEKTLAQKVKELTSCFMGGA